jgi:hypothetical protein
MTRERLRKILAEELEKAEDLPLGAEKHLCDLRDGINIGPGIEATLRAMQRVAEEAKQ